VRRVLPGQLEVYVSGLRQAVVDHAAYITPPRFGVT
jgi:hypothetical protein